MLGITPYHDIACFGGSYSEPKGNTSSRVHVFHITNIMSSETLFESPRVTHKGWRTLHASQLSYLRSWTHISLWCVTICQHVARITCFISTLCYQVAIHDNLGFTGVTYQAGSGSYIISATQWSLIYLARGHTKNVSPGGEDKIESAKKYLHIFKTIKKGIFRKHRRKQNVSKKLRNPTGMLSLYNILRRYLHTRTYELIQSNINKRCSSCR